MNRVKKIPLKEYWNLLSPYFSPMKGKFILLGLLLLGFIGFQVFNPFVLRYFVDTAVEGGRMSILYFTALLFIGIGLIQQGFKLLIAYLGETIGWKATNELRLKLVRHYLGLDMKQHENFTPGEMIERIDGDVSALQNFLSNFVVVLIGNLLLIICVLTVLIYINWRIGLTFIVFTLFALYVIERIRGIAVPYWRKVREISGKFFGFISENVSGYEDIRSNGAVPYTINRFIGILEEWLPALKKANLSSYYMWMTTILVFSLGTALSFGMGAYQFFNGAITLGTVFMIFQFSELLVSPIEKIRDQIEDLQKVDASIKRVNEILELKSEIIERNADQFPDGSVSVTFKDVSFYYNQNQLILKNINFNLPENQILGLLGRSGSGKTTIARLLLRFYEPTHGSVKFGNIEIEKINKSDLRNHVGIVTQDVQLFRTTLRNNLTLFDQSVSDKEILKVFQEFGLNDWYSSFVNGLDTIIIGEESGLSAGQAQLIALIRVFLKNPRLVILDEASSRLDPATESMIQNAMDMLLSGRTAIIIAHHLKTVQRANKILIMENGEIVEYGDREVLEKDAESQFNKLLSTGDKELMT